jgi:hypothetical protein
MMSNVERTAREIFPPCCTRRIDGRRAGYARARRIRDSREKLLGTSRALAMRAVADDGIKERSCADSRL